MKKFISTIICLGLLTAGVAGCSNSSSTSSEAATSGTTAGTTDTAAADTTSTAADTTAQEETAALSGKITMNGSTSMEKVIKALNGAFTAKNPEVTMELNLTGSGTGIQEAMEGKTDIGNSSRNLKDTETGLESTIIGIDGIAIIVNNANVIENVTIEELEKIYAGEIKNWSELGGNDKAIVVIGREDGSGTRDGFESIVMKNSEAQYAQELESTGSVISAVSTTDGAIGYASLANVDDSVKALKVNDVYPTEATVKDGTFAVQRPFLCVVNETNTNELVDAFLEFVLSDEGQQIVSGAGVVPVK